MVLYLYHFQITHLIALQKVANLSPAIMIYQSLDGFKTSPQFKNQILTITYCWMTVSIKHNNRQRDAEGGSYFALLRIAVSQLSAYAAHFNLPLVAGQLLCNAVASRKIPLKLLLMDLHTSLELSNCQIHRCYISGQVLKTSSRWLMIGPYGIIQGAPLCPTGLPHAQKRSDGGRGSRHSSLVVWNHLGDTLQLSSQADILQRNMRKK
ncbi:uncharacterized protein BJ212DRAFT_1585716 [Suillus subaureus]|uniref:Uncharacterized protein n=1 Tax=Suillus subaureus TaxID=48587 RepID=A0A9P7JH09_9AGAM|nr:uncharacterized protein BJ212DRAFT_1585716 [Suillus subaureus]KAG1821726.1 hypothetical protein BJ212DRAFT_1585716 [Suillus subaureus]